MLLSAVGTYKVDRGRFDVVDPLVHVLEKSQIRREELLYGRRCYDVDTLYLRNDLREEYYRQIRRITHNAGIALCAHLISRGGKAHLAVFMYHSRGVEITLG